MATPIKQLYTGLLNPGWLFLTGLILLLSGLGINHFYGMKGILRLEAGKVNSLVTGSKASSDTSSIQDDLGLNITLDSLHIRPHTREYEIRLWKRDSMPANPHSPGMGGSKSLVSIFLMEPMKINEVEKTDYRFRLKEFYPNFEFAYEYPADRDTIEPKAPGITLELKTREGTPIVTLRSDQPKKNTLGDIVSLGASLAFYWESALDSIKALGDGQEKQGNRVVFSGADHKVFFMLDGKIEEQPLKEKVFYKMPGQDSVGFTIIHNFPDIAYLKAVPSSRGTEPLNPVANIEVWKLGGSAQDAFVYPETRSRKGGEFVIPATEYKIGLGTVQEKSLKYCDCSISIQGDSTVAATSLAFGSGKSKTYKGYRFSPIECSGGFPQVVVMQVSHSPGKILLIFGSLMAGLALFIYFAQQHVRSS